MVFDRLASQTLYPIAMRGKGLVRNLPLIYPQNGDANEDSMRNYAIGAIC